MPGLLHRARSPQLARLQGQYLPGDLSGLLFCLPLRHRAETLWESGKHKIVSPSTQTVDADGYSIHPITGRLLKARANKLRIGGAIDISSKRKGAIFESERISTCLWNEELNRDGLWSPIRSSVSANAIISPDGNTTADKLVEASDSGQTHILRQAISVTSGQKVAISIFVKKGERTEILLQAGGTAAPAAATVWFDLDAGTKGTVGAGVDNSDIDAFPNGWYRCWLVFTADASDVFNFELFPGSGSETHTYNGDGSSGLYPWGAMCEENVAFPGSYIKNEASATTRAKDDIQYSNASEVNCKAAAGTIYIASTPQFSGTEGEAHYLFSIMGTNDGVYALHHGADGKIRYVVKSGGVTVANLTNASFTLTRGTPYVWTFVWDGSDFRMYRDGGNEVADTDGNAPTSMRTTIFLGQDHTGGQQADANEAHFHIYDSAHSAARVLRNTREIQAWLGI